MRVALVLGAILLAAGPAAAAPAAPAFTVTLLDGSGHFDSRAQLGKQVLVVRFQASWCKVCNQEAAMFERIYKKYRTSGVELVSVQVQDTEADARHFLEANKTTYPAGLDPRLKIANRFGFRAHPTRWSSTSAARWWRASTAGPTRRASRRSSIPSSSGPTQGPPPKAPARAQVDRGGYRRPASRPRTIITSTTVWIATPAQSWAARTISPSSA